MTLGNFYDDTVGNFCDMRELKRLEQGIFVTLTGERL